MKLKSKIYFQPSSSFEGEGKKPKRSPLLATLISILPAPEKKKKKQRKIFLYLYLGHNFIFYYYFYVLYFSLIEITAQIPK